MIPGACVIFDQLNAAIRLRRHIIDMCNRVQTPSVVVRVVQTFEPHRLGGLVIPGFFK